MLTQCLLRIGRQVRERLRGGDAIALAEELQPLSLTTFLLRVPLQPSGVGLRPKCTE
jgi:hypothetical protein